MTKKKKNKLVTRWSCTRQLPVYHSCFQVWQLSKTQDTRVYRHSGFFIHKLTVLVQIRESSWTNQKWNSASSENGRQDVVCCVLTEGGVRCTSALNITWLQEELMIRHGDVTPVVCVKSSVGSVPLKAPSLPIWHIFCHLPRVGNRLSKVLSPSFCCTGRV